MVGYSKRTPLFNIVPNSRRSTSNKTDGYINKHTKTNENTHYENMKETVTYMDLDPTSKTKDADYQGIHTNPVNENAASHPDAYQNLDPTSLSRDDEDYQGVYTNPVTDNVASRPDTDVNASKVSNSTAQQDNSVGTRHVPVPPAVVIKETGDSEVYYMNVKS